MNHVQQQQRRQLSRTQNIWAGQQFGSVRMAVCSKWLKPTGPGCLR